MKIKAVKAQKKEKVVKIKTDFIRLDSLLKFVGEAETGGQAKMLIGEEKVKLNGEICAARGKKIRNGDVVSVFSTDYIIKKSD